MARHFASFSAISPLPASARRRAKTPPCRQPYWFASVALVGNDRDTRVVETMQILAVHLHARGRKVFAESDSTVDFGARASSAARPRSSRPKRTWWSRSAATARCCTPRGSHPRSGAGARREPRPARLPRRHRLAGCARPARRDPRRALRAGPARDARGDADRRPRQLIGPGAQRRRAAEVADRPHARLRDLDRRPLRQHAPRRRPGGRDRDRLDCLRAQLRRPDSLSGARCAGAGADLSAHAVGPADRDPQLLAGGDPLAGASRKRRRRSPATAYRSASSRWTKSS